MIPGAKDCDYWRGEDPFTVEQVKAFKEAYDDYGFIDDYHAIRDSDSADKSKLKGNALKSFLLTEATSYKWFDGTVHTYPAGTWMLTSEITDPVAIKEVQDGTITGYSPSIFTRRTAERIKAALKNEASIKASAGGLIKDIHDPVPVLVSLVRKPCQHGNKFCKNNVGGKMAESNSNKKIKEIKKILGFEEKEEPNFATKEDLAEVKESFEAVLKSDEFITLVGGMIDTAVAKAVEPLSLKEDKKDDKKPDGDSEEDDETKSNKNDEKDPEKDDKKTNDDPEDKKSGFKSDSKALPQHNDNNQEPALKSDKAIVMETMGRDLKGRPLEK